jgi:hypothetical protein
MFVNRLTRLCALAAAGFISLPSARAQDAVGIQPLASIRAAAEGAVRRVIDPGLPGVKLEATALDPRVRLAACAQTLDTFANAPRGAQSRVIVRVSCASPAWTLNMPE